MAVSETRRLVMTGRKLAKFRTIYQVIDNNSRERVAAAGLPQWHPEPSGNKPEPDHDLIRKQKTEQEICDEQQLAR